MPYYLTRIPGHTLAESGAILAAGAAGAVLASPIGGRLIERLVSAKRLAIVGAAVIGAGLLLLSAWTEQTSTALQVAGLIVQGIGLGLFQLAYTDMVTSALPIGDRGVAGSLTLLTRMFGTVTAASLILMLFEILQVKHGFFEAFHLTFLLAAVLAFGQCGTAGIPAAQDRPLRLNGRLMLRLLRDSDAAPRHCRRHLTGVKKQNSFGRLHGFYPRQA